MSSSFPPRPLSLVPFLAADAVLLLTAGLVAWRSPDELAGGALLAVIFCVGLGVVLAVLPFVLNDAREREAALAERQRELVELVTNSTASATRWGTQWASAATGLEDAATLASRSLAAAELLPVAFQEKADAFAKRLEQMEHAAQTRAEKVAQQESALAARADQIGAASDGLQQTMAGFGNLTEELKAQHAAIAAAVAEFPAAAAEARVVRSEFEARIVSAPVQVEARIERLATEAEARLASAAEALTARLAEVETAMGALLVQCQRPMVAPAPEAVAVAPETVVVVEALPEVVVAVVTVGPEPVSAPEIVKPVARSEIIMDPFLIPEDGYAALAEAMDAGRA